MHSYKDLYLHLFRAMSRATDLIEEGAVILAYQQLISAQQEAEDAVIEFDILPDQ